MSLEDIRSECSDTAALLQPYVDGELGGTEQERVASHLESCRPCRAAVQEQHWVRATLRAVQREVAPAALRARIVGELDALDQDPATSQAAVSTVSMSGMSTVAPSERRRAKASTGARPSFWSRAMTTLADVARGSMVMVPASAVAVGLFFVAREGMVQVEPSGNLGASMPTSHAVHSKADAPGDVAPDKGSTPKNDLLVAPPRSPMQGDVQLVHARVADDDASKGASLHYDVMRDGRPTGQRVVDHQIPVGIRPPSGIPVVFGGHRYLLDQTAIGDPVLHFEVGGVAHKVVLEGSVRRSPQAQPDLVDFSFLLDFADRNIKERAAEAP
jgi:anti-sigma factor (TIGR02949 family)